MKNGFKLAFQSGILAGLMFAAASSGGCGSDGAAAGTTGGGGAGGVGGSAPSEGCQKTCAIMKKCAGADSVLCEQACGISAEAECAAPLTAWVGCVAANEAKLSTCGLETVCDTQFKTLATCQEQQSPTDAAATTGGAGGGMGGCDDPSCQIGVGGLTCQCSETCSGELRESQCEGVLGASVCACTKGATYLGSCFDTGGCEFAESCCASHF